jgi:hypothetical protein
MKWGKPQGEAYSFDKTWKAKKGGFVARVEYGGNKLGSYYGKYYFFIQGKGDYRFNSLWKTLYYDDFDSCAKAAEEWIDNLIAKKKIMSKLQGA